ncbi:MAG: molybdopterin-dependent oxidoreductase [Thermoleophilia bacterium]|nr:molybdopterin-dependent oxidoreductase [Thermoleophilia bacterium]
MKTHFELNGLLMEADVRGDEKLLAFLREELGLTGTKKGCDSSSCGSCTVIIDGRARRSCSVKLADMEGRVVETVEGLASGGELHPVQRAFLARGAFQCGFCTPGVIMASKALLDANPDPTDQEIRQALRRNICRCTGYAFIIDAVRLAARLMKGVQELGEFLLNGNVGESPADIEAVEKVSGKLFFADDYRHEGALVGRLVWSEHAHAAIRRIDTGAARSKPGVQLVLTAGDLPGANGIGWFRADQPVLADDRVKCVGDAVALVVAENREQADAACAAITVEYDPLPVVSSPRQSLLPGAPPLHPEGNVLREFAYAQGDTSAALDSADLVLEGHFTTPFVEHAYLETESALGELDEDGVVTIYTGTQYPFEAQEHVAAALGVPESQVRIVVTPIGGAFGGKTDIHPIVPLAGLAASRLGRPVKITLERAESLRSTTKRHAFELHYRVGFQSEGRIVAVQADMMSDAGPYTGQSEQVIEQACIFACGPYRIPNYQVAGKAIYTNNALGGAFRGYGINQVAFAMESLIDEASKKLGVDPVEIRLRNALVQGDVTVAGERLRGHVGVHATLRALQKVLSESDLRARAPEGWKRGVGVASAYKNVGWGRGAVDTGAALLRLQLDGSVLILAAAPDMGQGIRTGLYQIVRNVLGLGKADLEFGLLDTLQVPACNGGSAQRLTFCTGNAVLRAANSLRSHVQRIGEEHFAAPSGAEVRFQDRSAHFTLDGHESVVPLSSIAAKGAANKGGIEVVEVYTAPKTYSLSKRGQVSPEDFVLYPAYSYTSALAVVDVNEATGRTRVDRMYICQDVGRAINPKIIEGQIHGSCLQAIGYALTEEFPLVDGVPVSPSYGKLGVPSILATPEYVVELVESTDEHGPLGARGISEVAMVPACPAVTNAVADATGRRVYSLPAEKTTVAIAAGR